FLSTLLFHQGVLALLHGAGRTTRRPWVLTPTPPFGVPSVVSLAFWGGLWGILLWRIVRGVSGARHWLLAILLGAILPTAVAFLVVLPLKGLPVGGGWKPDLLVGALLLNGAWGAGVVLLMRLFHT
ncbi:MAG: hypothetical protein ACM3JH_10850, partial [Acidithiobacillales bacterium]